LALVYLKGAKLPIDNPVQANRQMGVRCPLVSCRNLPPKKPFEMVEITSRGLQTAGDAAVVILSNENAPTC